MEGPPTKERASEDAKRSRGSLSEADAEGSYSEGESGAASGVEGGRRWRWCAGASMSGEMGRAADVRGGVSADIEREGSSE